MPTDPPYDLAALTLDAERAAERRMTFKVCAKERQGARWVAVATAMSDLSAAVTMAVHLGLTERCRDISRHPGSSLINPPSRAM